MHDVGWQIVAHETKLRCGPLAARIDLRRPDRGLGALTLRNQSVAGCGILAVEIPGIDSANADVDFYSRGIDLVGTYGPTSDAWPFRTQIYWRARLGGEASGTAAIELVVSVQTNLLDSKPQLLAGSRLIGSKPRHLVNPLLGRFVAHEQTQPGDFQLAADNRCGCTLFRLPHGLGSYAEMLHPLNFGRTELTHSGSPGGDAETWSLKHPLFAESLEKGVILRARVLGAFLKSENDESQAVAVYREFAASEPPLTT